VATAIHLYTHSKTVPFFRLLALEKVRTLLYVEALRQSSLETDMKANY